MSADGEEGERTQYKRLRFDGNETPRSAHEDASTIAPHDIANDDWVDDSVASVAGGYGVSARRTWSRQRVEGVERDKRGGITRTCWIIGCQYKHGNTGLMKRHKAAKHGINVVWFPCDQDNCDYKAKEASDLKMHKEGVCTIGVVWHQCVSYDQKAKKAGNLKKHKQHVHNIGVVWHQCDSCDHKAKKAGNLKKHKQHVHNIDVVWHNCDVCNHKSKQASNLKRHKKRKH